MSSAIASILRAATRKEGEPLNILTASCHERYQSGFTGVNATFWLYRSPQVKDWNSIFAPLPANHILLDPTKVEAQLPPEVDFDVVFSQNKCGMFQVLAPIARRLHLPLISVEHTLAPDFWPKEQVEYLKTLRGDFNVFITEFSRRKWGWGEDEAEVIHHGCDTDVFCPDFSVEKKPHVLSVVNQFNHPDRKYCCGIDFWREATEGLPRLHIGESHDGWSQPAKSVTDLVNHYRQATVFVDTAGSSPIPTVVLEAMSSGCVVVSRGNAAVPEIIKDGQNGFICETPKEMREMLQKILARPQDYTHIGKVARETIVRDFSLDKFVSNWEALFRRAADKVFVG